MAENHLAVRAKVRMAPSPTGLFHVGSARTALYNHIFAKQNGAQMLLRIDDTDAARNDKAHEDVIFAAMEWLGLDYDGDIYRQSEHREWHVTNAHVLCQLGHAYIDNGAIRFRVSSVGNPDYDVAWQDMVYGEMKVKLKSIEDFVILKSDGTPTYNLASAVDDMKTEVTHIIRGEDGISNTPKQILMYYALGIKPPVFGHLPFILGTDRKKLSKRKDPVNVLDYAAEGILPDAMVNYLAMLGWNPGSGDNQEIFTRSELIRRWSIGRVRRSGAIFDATKMRWMDAQHKKISKEN